MIDVVGAVIWRDGKVLIVQRPDSAEMGGLWEFPGGKLEPGESHQQALARELREELALEVEIGPLYNSAEYTTPAGRHVRLFFYTCRLISTYLQLLWGQDFRWCSPTELPNYSFPPADAELIRLLSEQ